MFKNKDRKKEESDGPAPDDDFEKILREMERIVGSAFKTSVDEWNDDGRLPINISSDENERIPHETQHYDSFQPINRDYADIIEDDMSVSITLELPNARKENILLEVGEHSLEIHVDSAVDPYYKKVDVPSDVKPETTKATYKNGILDIEIEKKEEGKKGYRTGIA
ncbi:MAG: hypothetical protein DRN33_06145 [Thermoplasmata archaeon]|nr:MAG: hypothetical protein DRN33_06145 [Thermoplasmata archaeon]